MRVVGKKSSFGTAFEQQQSETSTTAVPDARELKSAIALELLKNSPTNPSAVSAAEVSSEDADARAQEQAGRLLDALLKSTSGGHLLLNELDKNELDTIVDAPPGILARYAKWSAVTGAPITGVALKLSQDVLRAQSRMDNLCIGLGTLDELRQLDLHLPPDAGQSIRLDKLATKNPLSITVTGASGMHLTVPDGCDVMSTGSADVAYDKAWVHYVKDDREVKVTALANFAYFRQPKEFRSEDSPFPYKPDDPLHSQQVAKFDKNGVFEFPSLGDYRQHEILCRHLTAGWLDARVNYQNARAQGSTDRFPMQAFTDMHSVRAMVGKSERDFRKARCRGMFSPNRYGEAVAGLLKKMAQKNQSTGHFMLSTTEHVVGLELQIEQQSSGELGYRATFYDPKHTATHAPYTAVGPRGLEELSKQRFELWARVDKEFPIYTIHDWPPRPEEEAQEPHLDPDMVLIDGNDGARGFGLAALKSGDPELVGRALNAGGSGQVFGFQYAMERGSIAAVRVYLETRLPNASLNERGAWQSIAGHTESPLLLAMQSEQADAAREYVKLIANAKTVSAEFKLQALLGKRERNHEAALYRVCSGEPVAGYNAPADFAGRRVAVNTFASEVAKADGLTIAQKGELLASRSMNGRSAARIAMERDNPGAAAAIMCAILEDTTPRGDIATLLQLATDKQNGPTLESVLTALAGKKEDPESLRWIARILNALRASDLDTDGELQNKFAAFAST